MVVITVSMTLLPPDVIVRMPITTDKYVELACDQEQLGFLLPLSYNLLLLLLCAIHGLLCRKLPENFNESWYIFVSVSTTLFIWVVFLPTYFSTFYAYHQVALLDLCLMLNGFITLLTLYAPKLYAVYFIEEDMIKFATSTTIHIQPNQIAPTE